MSKPLFELLVLSAQQGDEKAFATLVEVFTPSMTRFAYRLSGDVDLSADLVQGLGLS